MPSARPRWPPPAPGNQLVEILNPNGRHSPGGHIVERSVEQGIVEHVSVPQPSHHGDQQRSVVLVTPELVEGMLGEGERVVRDACRLAAGDGR
jgi:hypothetical protein